MEKVLRFHHHSHEGNLNELKFPLLYFDQIEVATFASRAAFPTGEPKKWICYSVDKTITNNYIQHIQLLKDANVLTIAEKDYESCVNYSGLNGPFDFSNLPYGLTPVVRNGFQRFFKNFQTRDEGGNEIFGGDFIDELIELEESIKKNKYCVVTPKLHFNYILSQAISILNEINEGKLAFTTSSLIDSFVKDALVNKEFKKLQNEFKELSQIEVSIALESLELNLPNISKLSFEDILEVRTQMKDEIDAFRSQIIQLSLEFRNYPDATNFSLISKDYVKANVNPKLHELERKLQGLKFKFVKNILGEIKDPKSYSPLVLSFFNNVSTTLIIMVSFGLISMNAAIDWIFRSK